ncbi:helix-turn-helix domain-containing protein [Hymenobacter terricola]|uniref:helix-turn-helix domain-containing protein n=1 Tax=Hymenobacter terricola TaxID=2819236 RepID=UPI001CF51838|nr:helix-turn-helix domain-containing protein [Hymenobacter terricola]
MLDPRNTLTDVCFRTGFQGMSHFISIVKKLAGHTPGELNRRLMTVQPRGCSGERLLPALLRHFKYAYFAASRQGLAA